MSFVHLHVHSNFSVDGGVAGVRDLARTARDQGARTLALTDSNTLAGVVPFTLACREYGLRPVLGSQLDVTLSESRFSADEIFKLVLLVETESGYRNLVRLISRAHANNHHSPFLHFADLQNNVAGLLALTGGIGTELHDLLLLGRHEKAEAHLTLMHRVFGKQSIVFEVQDFGEPRQKEIALQIAGIAKYFGMPCVATNDVNYLRPEDSICHDFLSAAAPATFYSFQERRDARRTRHMATEDEMAQRFPKLRRALDATEEIADRCAFQLNLEKRRYPVHDFVRGFDADSFLWDLTFREARARFNELTPEMKNRLNEEFDCIKGEGLSNNILLLWNVAQFCRRSRITLGMGRGSMISSVVAFVLGITQINPLEHKMRFLGFGGQGISGRSLSIEIPTKYSSALHTFLKETFGADFCGVLGRYQPTQRASLAREICGWFNVPFSRIEEAVMAPDRAGELRDNRVESYFPGHGEGAALPCPEIMRFMLARMLPRPRAITSAEYQFAISGENLNHLVPRLELEDEEVLQMDSGALDALNIPRLAIDFNPVLNVLDAAASWVRREENQAFDPDRIPLDDDETYALLGKGLTTGIDPFHSITLKSLLRAHRPRTFRDLIKIKSMDRPAGKDSGTDVLEHVPECLMTYRCAFIRAHYPLSFMAAMLTHAHRNRRKVFPVILREAKQMGLKILPPDINLSLFEFSQTHKSLRTGLMVVSGMGEKAYAELERVRRGGDFADLYDLCRRTDARLIHNRLLTNLAKSGAFDCFGLRRAQLLAMIEEGADAARKGGGPSLFDDPQDRGATLPQDAPDVSELSVPEIIRHEIAATGYCISHDQFHLYADLVKRCRPLSPYDLATKHVGHEVYISGFIEPVGGLTDPGEEGEQMVLDLEGRVVTMPIRAFKLYSEAISANAPVLVGGTVHRRKDELYLKALTVFTLRMVQQMSQQVLEVELDLTGENARTARLIHGLMRRYQGKGTRVKVTNFTGTAFGRWHVSRVSRGTVFFSPPFYYALKKILPEDRISLTVADDMSPGLLHALSPTRFPEAPQGADPDSDENSSAADAY